MTTLWTRAGIALMLALLTACAAQPSPRELQAAKESASLAPFKTKYHAFVTAVTPNGNRLDVAIDANAYLDVDDDAVAAFKKAAAADWRRAWMAANPGKHAVLTVRVIDFMGRAWVTERVKA